MLTEFNPLSPNIHIQILQTDLHTSPLRISWQNLIKDHGIFSMMIILLILITLSLDSELISLGENCCWSLLGLKVARYSFSGSIPPKFERKLRRHKQRFGKINTTVVLDKDENLLWSGLEWHRSCHSNEMTPLPILLPAVFFGTGNCSSQIVYWSFYLR